MGTLGGGLNVSSDAVEDSIIYDADITAKLFFFLSNFLIPFLIIFHSPQLLGHSSDQTNQFIRSAKIK